MAPIDDRPSDFNFRLFITLLGYILTHFAGTRRHNAQSLYTSNSYLKQDWD